MSPGKASALRIELDTHNKSLDMVARLLTLLFLLGSTYPVFADVSPELQRQIRSSTFEVVVSKPADSVTYEKPLPLELLPFIERTDHYRSIGTAFAIGPNVYVTAAHVLLAAVDSQFGPPALRASDQTVHSIANILGFSAAEDFVVFSLTDTLPIAALPTNRSPHIDDAVLAVGNALGEGVVVRDGLFTSLTPEEQDGRWKWIRFSAAASPGNSGGPLLDGSGKIIGIVIAKSPNENLNYALPIANVLDAPPSKARFDQRFLTKLAFAEGSKTYTLKDEFGLPLSWEKFTRAYQAVIARHNDEARAALLSAYADSMFPHGSGSESILYSSEPASRTPAVVLQQSDGEWTIQVPDLKYTDLPGDGKVGVATVAAGGVIHLRRGSEASDDAFYSDSKAFMDIALKALNIRRTVGSDQVRVVSLGAAISDVTTTDTAGRKWQVRVWPIPYLDAYLLAQLLPTPDGYAGLLSYVPSAGLREAKAQLSLLANQTTLTYMGMTRQWQAFLARKALLPEALKDVRVESMPQWKLSTPRFQLAVPPSVLGIDAHSELLLSMNYSYEGPRVIWGVDGAWWYHNAQEKEYLGLWRAPRPPPTAKLEQRTRFDDLAARRSPYDGAPVQATSDAVDVQLGIQAPGTKEGMASSGVAYGLSMRLDGHPAPLKIEQDTTTAAQAIRVLERGVGPDVTVSSPAPTPVATALDTYMQELRDSAAKFDGTGKDLRGRKYSEDIEQYAETFRHNAEVGASFAATTELVRPVVEYWSVAPGLVNNRDLWPSFLVRNHLPSDTPHSIAILAAESSLQDLLAQGGTPNADWTARSKELNSLYIAERKKLAFRAANSSSTVATYRARKSVCPAAADHTSGTGTPKLVGTPRSLEEYYPPDLVRHMVEGAVVLSLKVDASGCVTDIAVAGSSGTEAFDEAAMRWIETAAFLPGEKDGKAANTTSPLAVNFVLNR
jgi:serine protease Do